METCVAIVSGVYRHQVLAIGPVAECLVAGTKFIEGEADHYHAVEIVKMVEGKEVEVASLIWLPDSRKANHYGQGPGKVVSMGEYNEQMKAARRRR